MRLHWTWVFCEGAERAGDRRRTQEEGRATVRSGSAVRENQGAADERGDRAGRRRGGSAGGCGAGERERQNWQQAGAALGNEKHR